MGALGTYCFDGINFSQATSLYTDSTLTILAADGYYSQGGVIRQQLNGILLNAQPCSGCFVPCGNGISVSQSQNGFFDINFDVANTSGAVIAYFYMGGSIPDGVLANYDSTSYNRLTAKGNNGTTLKDGTNTNVDYSGIGNQGTGDPTYVGSSSINIVGAYTNTNTTPGQCSNGDAPENYSFSGGSFLPQGTLNPITVTNVMMGTNIGDSLVYTMVIPKPAADPTSMNLKISAPYCNTVFKYELDCPVELPSWPGSLAGSSTECNSVQNETYYFVRNASGNNIPFTVDTNTIPEIGNFVFTDINAVNYLNDTNTMQYYITGSIALGVRNGVVLTSIACTPAGLPCGTSITIPQGNAGLYNLDFDAGTSTGAIVIYFDPASLPDGIRALYNSNYYNALASPTNGLRKSTSSIADAFTFIGNTSDACFPSTPTGSLPYTYYDGFSGSPSAWDVGSPSPQNASINTADVIGGGINEWNVMVIPKPSASPASVSINVLGPCSNTGWYIDVKCPGDGTSFPSFLASTVISGTTCTTADQTYYFPQAKGFAYVRPIVNMWVFSDINGANVLANGNYVLANNTVMTVVSGVVTAIVNCT
mgnify:CR=1 FL=1